MKKMLTHPSTHTELFNRIQGHMQKRGYRPHTIKAYLGQVQGFARFKRPRDFGQVSVQDVRDYLNHLVASGFSRSMIDQAATTMEILCHEMLGNSLDLSGFKRPKKLRSNPVVLTLDEVTRIAVATVSPKHRLMIELAYSAGLRVSELVEVKVEHLDLGRLTLYVPGIGRKSRTTILTNRLKGALMWQVGTKDLSHYLFPSNRGGRLTTRAVAKFFKKALIASGLNKQATPHSLRQSFTHSMINQGIDPVALQSLLGQHTFTHMPPDSKRAA
jgi:site-specific recombinase XerD